MAKGKKPAELDPVEAYARAVIGKDIVAGRLVHLACERHLRDLVDGAQRGLRFDLEAAQRAIDFFPMVLRHSKGQFAGQPFDLLDWQKFLIGSLFGWKIGDLRRFRTAFVSTARKNGKALDLTTPIPTPRGWSMMGHLAVGDTVFDEAGVQCQVVALSPVMIGRPCYRVSFADGSWIVADAEHEWLVESRAKHGRKLLLTTEQMAPNVKLPSSRADRQERNYRIAVGPSLQTAAADLPVDPYLLGQWLADGHSASSRVTVNEVDADVIEGLLSAAGGRPSRRNSANLGSRLFQLGAATSGRGRHAKDSLQMTLREMGVLGAKHIPSDYLRASDEQRMGLLRGLMDGDGSISPRGQCEITTVNPVLRDGIVELTRSLGFKTSWSTGRATIRGVDHGEKYRVQFWAKDDRQVSLLHRKAERQKLASTKQTRSSGVYITAIEPVASRPVRCIQVDSPSHLYRAGLGMVATHNSTIEAGIGLKGLVDEGEAGAEIYSAATTRDQARIVFSEAERMRAASPALRRRITATTNNMAVIDTASWFRPLSADASKMDGLNVFIALVDEVHEHPNADVIEKLDTGMGARAQPLMYETTTAGVNRMSICYQHWDFSIKVLEGLVPVETADRWFAYIATIDDDDDWQDELAWKKANPSLGSVLRIEDLRAEVALAREMLSRQNAIRRLRLNQWTQQLVRWIDMDVWAAGAEKIDVDALRGRRCFAGLDLARVNDLSSLALVFPPVEHDEKWKVIWRHWCPEDNILERGRRDRAPYAVWRDQGHLIATEGNTTDFRFIEAEILSLAAIYDITELAVDRTFAGEIIRNLQDEGLNLIEFGQGFISMGPASAEFIRKLLARELCHGGDPVAGWCASNVTVRTDPAGNEKPDKERSIERIDPIVAAIMAIGRTLQDDGAGIYGDGRGLLVL